MVFRVLDAGSLFPRRSSIGSSAPIAQIAAYPWGQWTPRPSRLPLSRATKNRATCFQKIIPNIYLPNLEAPYMKRRYVIFRTRKFPNINIAKFAETEGGQYIFSIIIYSQLYRTILPQY